MFHPSTCMFGCPSGTWNNFLVNIVQCGSLETEDVVCKHWCAGMVCLCTLAVGAWHQCQEELRAAEGTRTAVYWACTVGIHVYAVHTSSFSTCCPVCGETFKVDTYMQCPVNEYSMHLFWQSVLSVSLQHVLKFAEMTQEIQMSQPSSTKLDFGLTPGRRKANQVVL
jgi:hypothetical protein